MALGLIVGLSPGLAALAGAAVFFLYAWLGSGTLVPLPRAAWLAKLRGASERV